MSSKINFWKMLCNINCEHVKKSFENGNKIFNNNNLPYNKLKKFITKLVFLGSLYTFLNIKIITCNFKVRFLYQKNKNWNLKKTAMAAK